MSCYLLSTSSFLKKVHHDIFQVVAEWYDKKFNPVFYIEQFLREFVSKGVQEASVDPAGI